MAPDWQVNAQASLRNYEAAYFTGNSRVAEAEFARARADFASTGRLDLVARAELVRCAAQVASLAFDDCPGFAALANDAGAAEHHEHAANSGVKLVCDGCSMCNACSAPAIASAAIDVLLDPIQTQPPVLTSHLTLFFPEQLQRPPSQFLA